MNTTGTPNTDKPDSDDPNAGSGGSKSPAPSPAPYPGQTTPQTPATPTKSA